jgi:hypothetical protein
MIHDDLTDDEVAEMAGDGTAVHLPFVKAALELQRHRAAMAADEERVRSVVSEIVVAVLSKLPTNVGGEPLADAIAIRVAKHLACAAVRLTGGDRSMLLEVYNFILDHAGLDARSIWGPELALLDRLLATVRPCQSRSRSQPASSPQSSSGPPPSTSRDRTFARCCSRKVAPSRPTVIAW